MGTQEDYGRLTCAELRNPRRTRGYPGKDSKVALETRLQRADAVERRRNRDMADDTKTSEELPVTQGTRCRVVDPLLAFAVEKAIAEEQARRRSPVVKTHRDANPASPAAGVDAAISARVAGQCNEASGRELPTEDGKLHRICFAPPRNANLLHGRSSRS